jgi:hypothetical protein
VRTRGLQVPFSSSGLSSRATASTSLLVAGRFTS